MYTHSLNLCVCTSHSTGLGYHSLVSFFGTIVPIQYSMVCVFVWLIAKYCDCCVAVHAARIQPRLWEAQIASLSLRKVGLLEKICTCL